MENKGIGRQVAAGRGACLTFVRTYEQPYAHMEHTHANAHAEHTHAYAEHTHTN